MIPMLVINMILMFAIKMTIDDNIASDQDDRDHDASDQDDQNTEGFSVHKTQKGLVECVDIHCSMFNVLMFSVECVDAVLMLRQGGKSVECSMSKPNC